ncbi:MAG: hypothetical protein VYA30_06350 [Myxococcota bacterium]|nr:hypothetical protein [Myxococcota bacterium]
MKYLTAIIIMFSCGCILESEECGKTFVLRDQRCVPAENPGEFGLGAGSAPSDAGINDSTRFDDVIDLSVDLGGIDAQVDNPWADFVHILIVDRTADGDAQQTPAVPGADIDGVTVADPLGMRVGTGEVIINERINDPYMASIQRSSRAGLGLPDGRAVSLGTQGGFIRVGLGLERPLRGGDIISIVEIDEVMGNQDRYEAFICRTDAEALRGCRVLGVASSGATEFSLDVIDSP